MVKFIFTFIFLGITLFLDAKPHVLVSIAPQKFLVENIAQDTLDVQVLVPPGASPHSFEPTPKQMMLASTSDMWFRIGESFETKAIEVLKSHRPQMIIVDTRKNIPLLRMSEEAKCPHCCAHGEDLDTHIWLSPRLAIIQATTVKEALVSRYPEHAPLYEEQYLILVNKLHQMDLELTDLFAKTQDRTLLVSHPAFGYLCHDYGLTQLSLEVEGKDPSPKQLTQLLCKARALHIKRVFTQEQYQNKGAHLIAEELKAEIYTVDPYSGDFLNNLRKMGRLFAGYH